MDLFVVDTAGVSGGVELFRKATDLEVHGKVQIDQIDTDRVINFNRSPEVGNTTDQHGLLIERRALGSGLLGQAAGGPGLPAFVRRVFLNTSLTPTSVSGAGAAGTASAAMESFVAAHELLHGCNVYHHGERDLRIDLIVKEVDGKLAYTATQGASTLVIPLAKEGACGRQELIAPPGRDAHLRNLYVAASGGQHSGVQGCLLRYNLARYYEGSSSLVIWRHTEAEPPGSLLCGAAGGTGVNAPGHCPQPRYGDAKVGCCKSRTSS
ncbi:MAG: hypothetical protein HY721_30350 [Planctomycetes bacterium]|nr:hypothetical protein [Planctomycetota bacterium]